MGYLEELEAQRNLVKQWGETKVVLSFGARNGGIEFAHFMRARIMEKFGYKEPNDVYLDCVALRQFAPPSADVDPMQYSTVLEARDNGGVAAMNGAWDIFYEYAMGMARVMIFVTTDEWADSYWCQKELAEFGVENGRRRNEKREPLRGIALTFPPAQSNKPGGIRPMSLTVPGMQVLPVTRVKGPTPKTPWSSTSAH